ncbi:MAG: hypothetical protein FJZ87_15065 [Chloroflexi bacterium]|nr:hypothetical protein [Chloroflexota bacterium]
MENNLFKKGLIVLGLIAAAIVLIRIGGDSTDSEAAPAHETATATPTPNTAPSIVPLPDSPLKESLIAAGDYLVRQQLSNGELSYQVNVLTGERDFSPSYVRLIAGTGALFTVCRVSGNEQYCRAGDRALDHYLDRLIVDPLHFPGACFYTSGTCQLGGSALAVDAIYKRWQATGNFQYGGRDLLIIAKNLGYFIASLRKPAGGFYHTFDPHYAGTIDPDYFVTYFPGESLLALLELHEMTGNEFWLAQAREVNDFMITQTVTEDHWHSYAFQMFARLDRLTTADKTYARQIAQAVIDGQVRSLNPTNTSISTATKIEALASLAQAFYLSGEDHEWLDAEIRTFITFVRARQLPEANCTWSVDDDMQDKFGGGIFSSCEEPSVRVDGPQHYINGITAYLEYQEMAK